MPGSGPKTDGKPVELETEKQQEHGCDDKTRQANGEDGQKAADIIHPATAPGGRKKTGGQAHRHGKAKGQAAEQHGNGEPLPDDVVDVVIAVFQRHPEIAMGQIPQITEVLFPDGLIKVVFGFEIPFDLRRRGFAFAIKRAAGGEVNQDERQRADDQQQRYGE